MKPRPRKEEREEARPAKRPPVAAKPVAFSDPESADSAAETDPPLPPVDEAELEREGVAARDILATLLDKMGLQATVTMQIAEEDDLGERVPIISITGDNLSGLIGPRGTVLNELQFVARAMTSQALHGRTRFVIDVDGYREKRVSALVDLARKTADKAVQFNRPIPLNPMPPQDRRIVHMTLRGDSRVITESKGEGSNRRVRVLPARPAAGEAPRKSRRRSRR
jgi:spoIIIJ-associated protein